MERKPYSKGRVGWGYRALLIARKQARTTDTALHKLIPTRQAHSDSCCARQELWVGYSRGVQRYSIVELSESRITWIARIFVFGYTKVAR